MKKPTIISFANNKGGVTKTFSAEQIGAIMSDEGAKVLLVDMDPQGNLSKNFGLKELDKPSVAEVILEKVDIKDAIKETYRNNLHILTADLRLMEAEDTIKIDSRRSDIRLKKALAAITETGDYDFILIDNSPAVSTLFVNSLTASDYILIPVECDANSLEGYGWMAQKIEQVKEDSNPNLETLGIFITKAEPHVKLHKQYIDELKGAFGDLIFDTLIPKAVVAQEAIFEKLVLLDYDKSHKLTDAYYDLTAEIIKRLREK